MDKVIKKFCPFCYSNMIFKIISFFIYKSIYMSNQTNWDELLETPPEWTFFDNSDDDQYSFSDDDLLTTLQPSTFDFLYEDDEDEQTKIQKKAIEEKQKKATEHGIFIFKIPGFIPDSIKFEYVYNEIPTRSIMLSNINPNATKEDLLFIFDSFGPYESCNLTNLSKGIATVQFYNMEDAQAMRVSSIYICKQQVMKIFHVNSQMNNYNSKQKKPKNNGTIDLFHLPSEINEHELHNIFSNFGKIRQIRNTPSKSSQKFIEFYDTRAAEKALKTLNGKPIVDKSNSRVSIEYSFPGGFKQNVQKYYKTTLPTIVRNKNNNRVSY